MPMAGAAAAGANYRAVCGAGATKPGVTPDDGLSEAPSAQQGRVGSAAQRGLGSTPCEPSCLLWYMMCSFIWDWLEVERKGKSPHRVGDALSCLSWSLFPQPVASGSSARCFLAQPLSGKEEKWELHSLQQSGGVSACTSSFPAPASSSCMLWSPVSHTGQGTGPFTAGHTFLTSVQAWMGTFCNSFKCQHSPLDCIISSAF